MKEEREVFCIHETPAKMRWRRVGDNSRGEASLKSRGRTLCLSDWLVQRRVDGNWSEKGRDKEGQENEWTAMSQQKLEG